MGIRRTANGKSSTGLAYSPEKRRLTAGGWDLLSSGMTLKSIPFRRFYSDESPRQEAEEEEVHCGAEENKPSFWTRAKTSREIEDCHAAGDTP